MATSAENRPFTPGSLIDQISKVVFSKIPLWWWVGFGIASLLLFGFLITIVAILSEGVGLWDINIPVVWGIAIVNLVFWIGIGHAGTFISAFLLLMRQEWRSTFSRYAEGMTLFALAVAGLFPLLHLGRPWFAYWLLPYPDTMQLNPQWRSPLVWDAFAITTYGIISLIFWYVDLIPDLAAMRDKADNRLVKTIYAFAALGWRGESAHWERLNQASYLFAAIATPLVISVHSIVGLDFAIGLLPGWHHTIFPPYFVAGAVFSGFAMVIIFGIMMRSGFKVQNIISIEHLERASLLMLTTGLMVTYGYAIETFGAFYLGHEHEVLLVIERATGPYAPLYWGMIFFNCILIQALWFKRVRQNMLLLLFICIGVLIGMWLERFVIISISLTYTYPTAAWELFTPTFWDWMTIITPFGLFLSAMFVFIKVAPIFPMYEKEHEAAHHAMHYEPAPNEEGER